MTENEKEVKDEVWKKFLRRHWKIILVILGATVGAFIVGVFVFLKVHTKIQIDYPALVTVGNWSMQYVVTFLLRLLLWEFVCVGIPIIVVAGVIFFQWWKKLPDDEREEYEKEPFSKENRRRLTAGGSGGIVTFLIFVTWLVIVWLDGNWTVTFGSWDFSYIVYSWLAATLWALLIFGLPVAVFFVWWLRRELKSAK